MNRPFARPIGWAPIYSNVNIAAPGWMDLRVTNLICPHGQMDLSPKKLGGEVDFAIVRFPVTTESAQKERPRIGPRLLGLPPPFSARQARKASATVTEAICEGSRKLQIPRDSEVILRVWPSEGRLLNRKTKQRAVEPTSLAEAKQSQAKGDEITSSAFTASCQLF